MIHGNSFWTMSVFTLSMTLSILAQPGPGPGPGPGAGAGGATAGMSPALSVLFQDFQAFTATADVELTGATKDDLLNMPMRVYYLNGDMRSELDMGHVKGPSVDNALAHTLQQIGMNQVITIFQPSAHRTMVLYPNRNAYITTPNHPEDDATRAPTTVTQKTMLGQEIVLGMTCTKSKVTFGEIPDKGLAVYIWESPRMRNFPVQIEMKQTVGSMTVRYRNISFSPPAQDQFKIPDGYKKHDDMQSILQEATGELLNPKTPVQPEP